MIGLVVQENVLDSGALVMLKCGAIRCAGAHDPNHLTLDAFDESADNDAVAAGVQVNGVGCGNIHIIGRACGAYCYCP